MFDYPSYLIHYGIEGQKWGVRRYQNEDGTYTEEGLRRREILESGPSKQGYKELKKNYKINVKGSSKEHTSVIKESGRDKLIQDRQKTNDAIEKVDDFAYKRAAELYDEYKDLKMYKAKLKGKEFNTSKLGMQEYFANVGIAEDYFTNSYANISYIASQGSKGTRVTKSVRRYYYY